MKQEKRRHNDVAKSSIMNDDDPCEKYRWSSKNHKKPRIFIYLCVLLYSHISL